MINRSVYRAGIQLLELTVSLTTASILIVGTASSVYLAVEGRDRAAQFQVTSSRPRTALERMRSDLGEAKSFAARSDNSVQFTVADRNADGLDETIAYQWTGLGTPLQYSENAGPWWELTDPLDDFSFRWHTNPPQILNSGTFEPAGHFLFQSLTQASAGDGGLFNSDSGTDLSLPLPSTYQAGDLLVAVLSVDGNQEDSVVAADSSWTKVAEHRRANSITLATFYSFGPTSNSLELNWPSVGRSYGLIAHFIPPSTTAALDGVAVSAGKSSSAAAPGLATSAANPLVLRMLATLQTSVPEDATNMADHVSILYRTRFLTGPAVGLAYRHSNSSGTIPSATFALTSSVDYVTATVVFVP